MGEKLERLKRRRAAAGQFPMPEWAGQAWRGLERGERILGLGVGVAGAVVPRLMPGGGLISQGLQSIPGIGDWLPDPGGVPEAARQFWELSRQGDWDAAITAAQEEMDAGPGYWGLSELAAGAVIPTGVPAKIGTGFIRAAPTVARTLRQLAPAASQEAVERGLITGITGLGKVARAPWEAEEWLGRKAIQVPAGIWKGLRTPLLTDIADAVDQGVADIADDLVGPRLPDEEVVPITPEIPGAPEPTIWAGVQEELSNLRRDNPALVFMRENQLINDARQKAEQAADAAYNAEIEWNLPPSGEIRGWFAGAPIHQTMDEAGRISGTIGDEGGLELARRASNAVFRQFQTETGIDVRGLIHTTDAEAAELLARPSAIPEAFVEDLGGVPEPLPIGETAYEGRLPMETEMPGVIGMRGQEEALLTTREGLEGSIREHKNLIARAGEDKRRASMGAAGTGWEDYYAGLTPRIRPSKAVQQTLAGYDDVIQNSQRQVEHFQKLLDDLPEPVEEVVAAPRLTGEERQARNIEGQRQKIYDREYSKAIDDYVARQPPTATRPMTREEILGMQEGQPDADILGLKGVAEDATNIELGKMRIKAGLEPDWEIDSGGNIVPKKPVEAPIDPEDRIIRDPREMGEAVALSQRDEIGRRIANFPGIKQIYGPLNRAAVAGRIELQGLVGRAFLMSEGQQKTQTAMASLMRFGKFADLFGEVDPSGFISMEPIERLGIQGRVQGAFGMEQPARAANPFAGIAPNDLRTNWRTWLENGEFTLPLQEGQTVQQKGAFTLNQQQADWLEAAARLEDDKLDLLRRNGIEIKLLSFEDGGEYAGRRVYGKFNSRTGELEKSVSFSGAREQGFIGSAPPQSLERVFKGSQAEALAAGYKYLPEEEALALNIQAAYNSVANKRFANWLFDNIPDVKMEPDAKLAFRKFLKDEKRYGFSDEALGQKLGTAFDSTAFVGDDAKQALDALKAAISPQPDRLSTALGLANQANAVARFFTLAGDVSPFMIQLLYMAGTNPVAYGKAMRGFGQAFLDPVFHDAYLNKHLGTTNLHRDLITTLKGVEMTEALDRGGWLQERAVGTGVGGVATRAFNIYRGGLERFQRGFNVALDVAGIEMAEGLEHLARNADGSFDAVRLADIDDFVNEMRGLASSAKLGVSPSMRQIETSLMLAPRYNRAIAALLWDTAVGTVMTGRDQALRTKLARDGMMKAVAGLSALNVALTTAHYIATTDEDKRSVGDWGESVVDHMVPTSSKFFTWDVLGRNIGPGTKVRSVLQLIARSSVDPMDLDPTEGFTMQNPLLRFLRGSSAPLIGRGIDVITGYNYIGEPTRNEIGDLPGWRQAITKVLLPNFVPIWAQAVLFEGGTPQERAVGAVTEFFGGRGSPLTRTQEQQRYHQQDPEWSGTAWEDLPISILRQYDKRLTEETGDPGYRGPKRSIREDIDIIDEAHTALIAEISEQYLRDDPLSPGHSPRRARELIAEAKANRNNLLNGPGGKYQELYGKDEREEPDPNTLAHVRWKYYKMYEEASDAQGKINFTEFEPKEMQFWASLDEEEANWLLKSIHLTEGEYHPRAKQLAEATRWVSKLKVEVDGADINYWNVNKHPKVIARLAEMVPSLERVAIEEYMDMPQAWREDLEEGQEVYRILAEAKRFLEASPNKANKYAGGLIHNYKDEFLQNAPSGWLNTMIMYGFEFPGRDKAMERYRAEQATRGEQAFREAFYLPPYREQYGTMMKAKSPAEVMFGRTEEPEEVGVR